jgi:hypothetical protein
MTSLPSIIEQAEEFLRELAADLVAPRPSECLSCYVARMLDDMPCDGSHRHALRYRDALAPRATALLERLSQVGACCCDCELFANGYQLRAEFFPPAGPDDDDRGLVLDELPPCAGVRRGSIRPCRNWVRIYRR